MDWIFWIVIAGLIAFLVVIIKIVNDLKGEGSDDNEGGIV